MKIREIVYKFLDKHYPVTGIEIDITDNASPHIFLYDVFGSKEPYFNDWAKDRTKTEDYQLIIKFNYYSTWYSKDWRELKRLHSDGYWIERTYNNDGKQTNTIDSKGYWSKKTYDERGNQLTYKDADGEWTTHTYDEDDRLLTTNGNRFSANTLQI